MQIFWAIIGEVWHFFGALLFGAIIMLGVMLILYAYKEIMQKLGKDREHIGDNMHFLSGICWGAGIAFYIATLLERY